MCLTFDDQRVVDPGSVNEKRTCEKVDSLGGRDAIAIPRHTGRSVVAGDFNVRVGRSEGGSAKNTRAEARVPFIIFT